MEVKKRIKDLNQTSKGKESSTLPEEKKEVNWEKFHDKLNNLRDSGLPILLRLQKIRNPFLDAYFEFADFCGEELFFSVFVPLNIWQGDRIGFHICLLISVIAFGNYFKNVLQVKRPSHPQLWNPKGKQKVDHGLPSTHTMSSIVLPFYYFIYHYVDFAQNESSYLFSFWVALALTCFYSGSIIISRLYLGYHSPLDVACGFVLGVVSLFFFYFFLRHVLDAWICLDIPLKYGFTISFLVGASFLYFHPQPDTPTSAWAESAVCFGSTTGGVLGFLLKHKTNFSSYIGPISLIDPASFVGQIRDNRFYFFMARIVVGSMCVVVVRWLAKSIFLRVFTLYHGEKNQHRVAVPVKFFVYCTVGLGVILLAPAVFRWAGLFAAHDFREFSSSSY